MMRPTIRFRRSMGALYATIRNSTTSIDEEVAEQSAEALRDKAETLRRQAARLVQRAELLEEAAYMGDFR